MSRIVLVRHGPVRCDRPFLLDRAAFQQFCADYETADLHAVSPPAELEALSDGLNLFASASPRARESALRVSPSGLWRFDPIFAEEPMHSPAMPGRWPLLVWFAAARGRERLSSAAAAKRRDLNARAQAAAQVLSAKAPCMLVGHGWFNRHLARALVGLGYREQKAPSPGVVGHNWSARIQVQVHRP